MNSSCKYHWPAKTTQFTWAQCISDHQSVSQQPLFLIQALSILQSPVLSATITLLVTSNSRSLTQHQTLSSRETKFLKDAEHRRTICTSQTLRKFLLKLHLSWPTDPPSSRVSFGKTIHASNLSKQQPQVVLKWKCNWKTTSALCFNSLLFINPKDWVQSQTEFLVCHLTKIWARRNCTTCGLLKTMELLTMPW